MVCPLAIQVVAAPKKRGNRHEPHTIGKEVAWGNRQAAWLLSEQAEDDARWFHASQYEIVLDTGWLPSEKPALFQRAMTLALVRRSVVATVLDRKVP